MFARVAVLVSEKTESGVVRDAPVSRVNPGDPWHTRFPVAPVVFVTQVPVRFHVALLSAAVFRAVVTMLNRFTVVPDPQPLTVHSITLIVSAGELAVVLL